MSGIKRFLITLGETVDPFKRTSEERFLPTEWRGKSIEQRAASMIAESYEEGIRQTRKKHPELSNVRDSSRPAYAT